MNFSAWSIRNPIAPLLAFALLLFLGLQSFFSLPITRFPNIDVPVVSIFVAQSGAAPAEMEKQVTKEIEDAVAGITGVKNITSTINDGVSSTGVEFRMEIPSSQAVQDVKDAIDKIRSNLPADIEAPIVSKIDVAGQAIQTFSVSSKNMTLEELSWFVDDTIKRALQGKPGIGQIDRYGGAKRELRVELDPLKLKAFGVSAGQISQQLKAVNIDLGSGRGKIDNREQAIRTLGDVSSLDKLSRTVLSLPNGTRVMLADIGKVIDTYEEPRSFSRYNGDQVVSFAVFRTKGSSEVTVANTVESVLTDIETRYPDVKIQLVNDEVYFTEGNYESALHTMFEGAILAVLVVLIFLRNWRATFIAAVALPLSAIPTFWAMDLLGFSLNLISFLAITLATGILVDDAIVEIENIARHIRMGKTPYRAAIEAADEIGLAVIATTFTITAVFVPVSFMPGIPGQYFKQFGLTVAIAVMFSLLVARLITPLMAAYLMRPKDAAHEDDGHEGYLTGLYTRIIKVTLRWRYMTLLFAFLTLAGSLYAMVQIPGSFIPPDDTSRIIASIELPPGSTLADTDVATEKVRQIASELDGVQDVFVLGGSSPTGESDVRRASVNVMLERREHSLYKKSMNLLISGIPFVDYFVSPYEYTGRTRPQSEVEQELFRKLSSLPDMRAFKLNDRGERDISYNILSDNDADLNSAVATLEGQLRSEPLLTGVSSEGALPRPEIQVIPRDDEAARLGITTAQISKVVLVATMGDASAALAKSSLDGRMIPIRVQASYDLRSKLSSLRDLRIPAANGTSVPLSAIADIKVSEGASTIKRFNRERRAEIGAGLPAGVALNTATTRFQEIVDAAKLPASVRVAPAGDAEIQKELSISFGNAMLMGLFLVLTVLILLFKDVIQPFTILFSLPLAIGGVAAALIITSNPVSMPVLIGILMLMGIVTKNAILLIDFAIEKVREGMNRHEAMIDAGRKRAQPIIMTSIAMSAGMLPSAMGVGEGGTFRAPMATAVIGGIIVSTVLSLIVVPSFFLIMDDLSKGLGRLFSRFIGTKDIEEPVMEAEQLTHAVVRAESEIDDLKNRIEQLEKEAEASAKTPRLKLLSGRSKAVSREDDDKDMTPLAAE